MSDLKETVGFRSLIKKFFGKRLSSLDRGKLRGPTQLRAAVVVEDPGEDGVLREVVAAAVGQVVEVEEILVVAEEAALPLQHVALGRVLRHVILWRDRRPG